ncbi:hypothetical protein W97_07854 [Coniosporium apollinis CBS 100218]|uniref:Autophagy-related protein 13 n=1 Tax=Coniosporium apollinis (strain CBS 100218) TaxID=1168221 RepID=R7Z3X8_CONA1|nr:uncharacterized protein W97_07854 [Coniosporium apollinis CBS 100218]EON68596.1 hypothetical protein W97_07854 [Coniosporium apollinis CBS 100218]
MSSNENTADDYGEGSESSDERNAALAKENNKLNQVIRQFHVKAALTITSLRISHPPSFNNEGARRYNKWFNVVIEETDALLDDLAEWRQANVIEARTPRLLVEIYLDLEDLAPNQTLVILDQDDKAWDVREALNQSADFNPKPTRLPEKLTQVVLERWCIEVGDRVVTDPETPQDPLPNVYKRGVVLFRSLYTQCLLLPASKYYRNIAKLPATIPSLRPKYRISNGEFKSPRRDTLNLALHPTQEPVTDSYRFSPSKSPVGPLCVSVDYRMNCDFRVDDAESYLSSQFMGVEEPYFKPSLAAGARAVEHVPGSLPIDRSHLAGEPDRSQAYGSLSTYHQVGPATGTSPISALRAVRDMPSQSPQESPPQKLPPNHRIAQGSKSSLRSNEGVPAYQRRPSVSFQPFKAGSLSSSPAPALYVPPSPGSSAPRTSGLSALQQARNRNSLNALPQTALRTPSIPNETAIVSSASGSPKPAPISRFSSSFGNRRSRFSSGGTSKTEEDNTSSGKASLNSSAQRGSGTLNEGEGTSSGSVHTDEGDISDFLKQLESNKELKSFSHSDVASRDAATRRTNAQLSKFRSIKDSNATTALSDSLYSSLILHRSSSSSSRQLSSVPAMIAGTSVSTSSSPGKPISPHTPHTPAIPSRLSAHSVLADDTEPTRSRSRSRRIIPPHPEEQLSRPGSSSDATTREGTTAIPIPTSPHPWQINRRSSSVSQQHRVLEEELDSFGMRSASLPNDERPDLSLSELLHLHEPSTTAAGAQVQSGDGTVETESSDRSRPESRGSRPTSAAGFGAPGGASLPLRSRLGRPAYARRGSSSAQGSSRELGAAGGRSRWSFRAATADDEEPLLFTMSELENQQGSRRSIEEGRRGRGSSGWR